VFLDAGTGEGFGFDCVDPPLPLAIYPMAPAAAIHAAYSAGAPRVERPNENIAAITLAAARRPAHAATPIAAPLPAPFAERRSRERLLILSVWPIKARFPVLVFWDGMNPLQQYAW
jgi:hypothetical protein